MTAVKTWGVKLKPVLRSESLPRPRDDRSSDCSGIMARPICCCDCWLLPARKLFGLTSLGIWRGAAVGSGWTCCWVSVADAWGRRAGFELSWSRKLENEGDERSIL